MDPYSAQEIFDVFGLLTTICEKRAKMLKKRSLLRTLACFVLLPFLFIASPESDEAENLNAGNSSGLFALSQDSEDSSTTEKNTALIGFLVTSVQRRFTPFDTTNCETAVRAFTSESILSVTSLRC